MTGQGINQAVGIGVIVLSLTALLTVVVGYTRPPLPPPPGRTEPDEGALAHIFQMAIVLLAPAILLYLVTTDWTQPVRSLRPLAFSAAALVVAFAALYYLEHYFYPGYYQ